MDIDVLIKSHKRRPTDLHEKFLPFAIHEMYFEYNNTRSVRLISFKDGTFKFENVRYGKLK